MTRPVVTGDDIEGQIGNLHEEDIVLEFVGSRPDQLITGCYYEGTVDGYADFGVFVNVGDNVTGLLHRSELPRRLESLEWDPGDTVYVQVKNVRDNGNVDLGWSIREGATEFRGQFVHDPEDEYEREQDAEAEPEPEAESGEPATDVEPGGAEPEAGGVESAGAVAEEGAQIDPEPKPPGAGAGAETEAEEAPERERAEVANLADWVGDVVRLEGVITSARQTSGPTVFELQDETGTVDCAAFEEAGVRAYPEADAGDLVQLDGEVRERRGELQIETERLIVLEDEAAARVSDRMDAAIEERARAAEVEPLAEDPAVASVADAARGVATAVRKAVIEERPVIVRHDATVDCYLGGAAIERATLPLVREEHTGADAAYHYFDRRPLETVYDMDDATNDVTAMLGNRERHDEKLPLFVFVAAAGTADSVDGLDLLGTYDVERVVIETGAVDKAVRESADAVAAPDGDTSATAVAAAVATSVAGPDVADDLAHLPAASFWEDAPGPYAELAREAGYDADRLERVREAIALEAYYQSYEDKRELVSDLLFDGKQGLVERIAEQFREKLAAEVETAEANLDRRERDGLRLGVLDTDAYTHRFDFPPTGLLLDEVHRRARDADAPVVTLGVADDELRIRSTEHLDVRRIADKVREAVPNAGVSARGGTDRLVFVTGERERVREATIDAVAAELSG